MAAGCPEELLVGREGMEDAALTFGGAEDFVAGTGGGIGDVDGPRFPGAMGACAAAATCGADEGDLLAVGRPLGIAVGERGGREGGDGFVGDGIDADEAVVAAIAGEGAVFSIGRPEGQARCAAGVEHELWLGVACERDTPDAVL